MGLKIFFLVGAGMATILPSHAMAQTSTDTVTDSGMADIIVTANKREQSLNKVGLTITALGADDLAKQRISTFADIAAAVPGLVYSPSTNNTPIFTLRGVGFNNAALGVYPAVSLYLDQAPLAFPVLGSRATFDLERIEVLKGPQGTLFGNNATGGAINYIAAKPTSVLAAGGDLTYGRFNNIEANAFISGPLSDTLRARVAINAVHTDDWQRSSTRNDTLGEQKYIAGRVILDWQPTDRLKVEINLNGSIDKSDPQALQYFLLLPNPPGVNTAVANTPFSPRTSRSADWSTGAYRPSGNRRTGQAVLRLDYDVTNGATLTSMTTYNAFKQRQVTDGDGMATALLNNAPDNGSIRSFNQEIRLANQGSSDLNWVVGANYEKSRVSQQQSIYFPDGSVNHPGNLNIYQLANAAVNRFRNIAGFGNVEYKAGDALTLKAGIRYTDSRISADICGYDAGDGRLNALYQIIGSLFSGTSVPPLAQGACFPLNSANLPGTPFADTLHQKNVSWRVGADYQLSSDLLFYANISRGYKAGSYPIVAASSQAQLFPAKQESVTAYETGFKASLAHRKVQINGAGFYYDYKDKQVLGKIYDNLFGLLDKLVNVPKSRIFGAELELTARPANGLTMRGGVTYLNSKVQEYSGYDVLGGQGDFRGVDLPFTPKFTYTADVEYRAEGMVSGGTPYVGASLFGRSAEDAAFNGSRLTLPAVAGAKVVDNLEHPFRIPGYATVDLRVGYDSDSNWRIMIFAKNVFDKYYITNVIPGADSSARFSGRPATYGVTVGFKL